jgi:hypothetical protein
MRYLRGLDITDDLGVEEDHEEQGHQRHEEEAEVDDVVLDIVTVHPQACRPADENHESRISIALYICQI